MPTYVSIDDNSTFLIAGIEFLQQSFVVQTGALDSVGLGTDAVNVPPGLTGLSIYSQAVILDATGVEATDIATSTIFF